MALTKISNNSLSAISTLPASIPTGALTLLSTQTASSSASIEFTSGIDSTYDSYVFKYINMQSANTDVAFQVNFSTDGGSNYNVTKTTTFFYTEHGEDGSGGLLSYLASRDEAQSTDPQHLTSNIGRTGSHSASGTLHLYNPSNTTFVKHFISTSSNKDSTSPGYNQSVYVAGYANTTSAVDAIQFTMQSGNINAGIIKMYGVS